MCTHNGARFLPEQLASIVVQSRLPDEMVICDDCSKDETSNILEDFVKNAPFPVYLHFNHEQLGVTQNFARAISLCEGEIIALSDQDDVWLPNKLALIEQRFESDPKVGVVFSDAVLIDENGKLLGKRMWEMLNLDSELKKKISGQVAFEIFDRFDLISGMTMAFRSQFKKLVLPIPGNIPLIHDGWLATMIAHVASFDLIDEALVKYRQHSSQQVGARVIAPRKSSLARVGDSTHGNTVLTELNRVEPALDRITSCAGAFEFRGRENLELLRLHCKTRLAVSERKVQSIPALVRELVSGRYHRYSNGFLSFLKDLFT